MGDRVSDGMGDFQMWDGIGMRWDEGELLK